MKGLFYLSKSTNFWNAIIGAVFTVATFLITKSETIALSVSGLFIVRGAGKALQDYAEKKTGIAIKPENLNGMGRY